MGDVLLVDRSDPRKLPQSGTIEAVQRNGAKKKRWEHFQAYICERPPYAFERDGTKVEFDTMAEWLDYIANEEGFELVQIMLSFVKRSALSEPETGFMLIFRRQKEI